jgi:hypothetical protein
MLKGIRSTAGRIPGGWRSCCVWIAGRCSLGASEGPIGGYTFLLPYVGAILAENWLDSRRCACVKCSSAL